MAGQGEQRRPVFAPRPEQDGRLDLPAQQEPFDRTQYVDWMAAFVKLVEDNAASLGGRTIDVAQNSRLGDLLSSLEGAP